MHLAGIDPHRHRSVPHSASELALILCLRRLPVNPPAVQAGHFYFGGRDNCRYTPRVETTRNTIISCAHQESKEPDEPALVATSRVTHDSKRFTLWLLHDARDGDVHSLAIGQSAARGA